MVVPCFLSVTPYIPVHRLNYVVSVEYTNLKILGKKFCAKLRFECHLIMVAKAALRRSISRCVLGSCQTLLRRCFLSYTLPVIEQCSSLGICCYVIFTTH